MNILLLGNGFDLHHKLPTKYINFLHTVDFLSKNTTTEFKTIGDVFGNSKLFSIDKEIKESYELYKDVYDKVELDKDAIDRLRSMAKSNMWYSYLSNSIKEDITWIDFEQEISRVVECFRRLLSEKSPTIVFRGRLKDEGLVYIAKTFDFYLDPNRSGVVVGGQKVKDEYVVCSPIGSENKIIDKQKIVDVLYSELEVLAEGLKIYLKCFVESIVKLIANNKAFDNWKEAFESVDKIISFNYTNTCEKIYEKEVIHLHGSIDSKIILGINPDESDMLGTVDTLFMPFKKYFQRVINKTDDGYIGTINDIVDMNIICKLVVIGHSLDTTDKDIIEQLFSCADQIYVLEYNKTDAFRHIKNLVKMFGKSDFDSMRNRQKLVFAPLLIDMKDLIWSDIVTLDPIVF